ncbi:MAG: hypothetical protein KY475_07730 [Planctomycetes bacterium]|nr:hypothetical protein [Planctomycetota bacterium]
MYGSFLSSVLPSPFMSSLLAQADGFRHMGKRFQPGGTTFDWKEAAIAAAVLIGPIILILAGTRFQRWRVERRRHSPHALFKELCHAHGLSRGDRRFLSRLARQRQLPQPSLVFVDSQYLDAQQTAAAGERSEDAERLYMQLFGGGQS